MQNLIYLDNAATTPCDKRVAERMADILANTYGNPSSHYSIGYEAKELLDEAREKVAAALNAQPNEIFFTGCGSEADNWAVKGAALAGAAKGKKHLVTTAFEHHAILNAMAALEKQGFTVTYVKPDRDGMIHPEDIAAAIRPDTALVSVMLANNEIGTIQPIVEIATICREKGVLLHTDAVQAVGAIPVDVKALGVDLLSLSGHKFNGPKGVGALYCRRGVFLPNLIDGGGQESRRRAGTENLAGIVGMAMALELAVQSLPEKMAHQTALRDYVIRNVLDNIPDTMLNGSWEHRLPGNANLNFLGLEGETILLDLDMHGICASTGSACNSDSLDPSHVLAAIGVPEGMGHGSMRFSFGPQNTMEEVQTLCEVLKEIIPMRRKMSCMWMQDENKVRDFYGEGAV